TFTDQFATAFPAGNKLASVNDTEGSAWADVFNTGSPDLLQLAGGTGGKHFSGSFFFVNRQGQMTDEAPSDNLANGVRSGREPFFLDWNHDGLLDVALLNFAGVNGNQGLLLYQQSPTGFVDVTSQTGLSSTVKDPAWVHSVDLNGDGLPDLL